MRFKKWPGLVFVLLLIFCVAPWYAAAQADAANADYAARRRKAEGLVNQGQYLEALPLLEELVKSNPQDDDALVALALSLVKHAATLEDLHAANKERSRARDLLEHAQSLGNTSTLAQNLSEILEELSRNGDIKFSDNPAVEQAMRAGEAAFSRRDFPEAVKNYTKALELEPKNYYAALFIGNAYDRQRDVAKAAEGYEHAIQLNANIETAYRYYADMLANRQGNMAKARTMLIRAAVAEPYNNIVWREMQAWAKINNGEIKSIHIAVPPLLKDNPQLSPEVSAAWEAYYAVKVRWRQGEFTKRFPQEAEYRRTLAEETEALEAVAVRLQKLKDDKKTAALVTDDRRLSVLVALHQAGLIEPYVLFGLGDDEAGIASEYAAYREKNRLKLEEYVDKFVIAPAPAPGAATKQAEQGHAKNQPTAQQGTPTGEANQKEGEAFLAANKTKEGVVTLPSGLQYKILKEGDGPKPTAADSVVCNYRGTFINGTEFDSSYKRGQPTTFPVRGVIRGWTEALQLMPAGSKWQLFIPSSLAYGPLGAGGVIPPSATLIFEVELISIQSKEAPQDKK